MDIKPLDMKESRYYTRWLKKLRDPRAKAHIRARVRRLSIGNPGDHKDFGDVSELRIDHGPGYRVYYTMHGEKIILLLVGGDKSTQNRDLKTAREMVRNLKEGKDDDRY